VNAVMLESDSWQSRLCKRDSIPMMAVPYQIINRSYNTDKTHFKNIKSSGYERYNGVRYLGVVFKHDF
jgi:hypothetical protein